MRKYNYDRINLQKVLNPMTMYKHFANMFPQTETKK